MWMYSVPACKHWHRWRPICLKHVIRVHVTPLNAGYWGTAKNLTSYLVHYCSSVVNANPSLMDDTLMRVWGVSARATFYCGSCNVCVCHTKLQYPCSGGFIIYSVAGVSKLNKCNLIRSACRRIRAPATLERAEYFQVLIWEQTDIAL